MVVDRLPYGFALRPTTGIGSLFGLSLHGLMSGLFSIFGAWTVNGTRTLLTSFSVVLNDTSGVTFGTGFHTLYLVVRGFGAQIGVALLLIVTLQALLQNDFGLLVRVILVRLPAAFLLSGVAVEVVAGLLVVSDSLSRSLLATGGQSITSFLSALDGVFTAGSILSPATTGFEGLLLAVALGFVVFLCWLELVLRSAAITIVTLFLPLAFAGVIWPATQQWLRRLAETLFVLIISKVIIAGIYALALVSFGHATGAAMLVNAIAIFLLCAWAPFTLLHLVPIAEGSAMTHLSGLSQRATQGAQRTAKRVVPMAADAVLPEPQPSVDEGDDLDWAPVDPNEILTVDPEDRETFSFLEPFVRVRDEGQRPLDADGSPLRLPPSVERYGPGEESNHDR